MKKNWVYKFGFLVLVLTLITTSLVSGTYAKYSTEVEATDTVTVAKWVANFDDNAGTASADFTFNFFETFAADSGVDGSLLAPGTAGSFNVVYDTDTTQVARDVDITMDVSSLVTGGTALSYLEFSKDNFATTLTPTAGILTLLDETYGPTDDGGDTITVYWRWPFDNDGAGGTLNDAADTADGETPITDAEITITFTAEQNNL